MLDLSILTWELCHVAGVVPCVNTTLPMTVHETLLEAGLIEDPLLEGSDIAQKWIAESDWILTTNFSAIDEHLLFEFSGVNTVAHIELDGRDMGYTDNAFVTHKFHGANLVVNDFYKLRIHIHSSVNVAAERRAHGRELPYALPVEQHGFDGVQYVRTAPYLFGWDWGIATGSMGVDKVVTYAMRDACEPEEIQIDTVPTVDDGDKLDSWELSLNVSTKGNLRGCESTNFSYLLQSLEGSPVTISQGNFTGTSTNILCENVSPWFPASHGKPQLFSLRICASTCILRFVGFRTVEFRKSTPKLILNRIHPIEIRGVNLVPHSAFRPPRDSKETDELFKTLVDLGVNLVRIWGGGWYGSDYFYNKADYAGILVWEEFKFACATYPMTEMAASVKLELQQQLRRIHSHPSLVIVSGDNEVDLMLKQNWFDVEGVELERLRREYELQKIVFADNVSPFNKDDKFVYVPSSPSDGFDIHYYDYSSDCLEWRTFPNTTDIVSEFGYQSWCSESCLVKGMKDPASTLSEPWVRSEWIAYRQHRVNGNEEIWQRTVRQLPDISHRRSSMTVSEFAWLSQVTHAVCLKSATETFRRNKVPGVMVWQLNDVWPTASWSLIGYGGVNKPAYYAYKQSVKPDTISLFVDGEFLVIQPIGDCDHTTGGNISIRVVNIFNGESYVADVAACSVNKFELSMICPSRACIAAADGMNYIPLGPLDRSEHQWSKMELESPVSAQELARGREWELTASIPTPYVYLECSSVNISPNWLFLSPASPLETTRVHSDSFCDELKVYHFWSYIDATPGVFDNSPPTFHTE